MIEEIVLWPPILWTLRIVLGILLFGVGLGALLIVLRLLWPPNVWKILAGKMPLVREVGWKLAILGQEIAANAVLDIQRDQQMHELRNGLVDLETKVKELSDAVDDLRPGWR